MKRVKDNFENTKFEQEYCSWDKKDRYRLLSRMQSDCDYYLGNGGKYAKHLWANDEEEHIKDMISLWNSFSADEKPEWLTYEELNDYSIALTGKSLDEWGVNNISDSRKIKDAENNYKKFVGSHLSDFRKAIGYNTNFIPLNSSYYDDYALYKFTPNKYDENGVRKEIYVETDKEGTITKIEEKEIKLFTDSKKIKDADETPDVLDGILMIAFNDGSEEEGYNEVKKHANEQGELDGVQYETYDTDIQDGVTLIDLCAATDDANAFVKALLTEWGIIDAVADIEFEKSELMENAEVSDSRKVSDSNEDELNDFLQIIHTAAKDHNLKVRGKQNWHDNTLEIEFGEDFLFKNPAKIKIKQGSFQEMKTDLFSQISKWLSKHTKREVFANRIRDMYNGLVYRLNNYVSDSRKVNDMTKPAHLRGYAEKYRKKRREQRESYKENDEEKQDKEVSDSRRIKDSDDEYLLQEIANQLEEGYHSGYDPQWDIDITVDGADISEFNDDDKDLIYQDIAYVVKDGYDNYMGIETELSDGSIVYVDFVLNY